MRFEPFADCDHFVRHGHFEIDRQISRVFDLGEIFVADMTAVFAQMDGDAIRATFRRKLSGAHNIRMAAAAGIPDGCNMVNIDAEAEMSAHYLSPRLPGL